MKDKQLRQLLRDKLQNYEAPVPKGDWQAIADRLPSTATSADNHWRGLLHHKMASYTTPLPENDWHDNMLGRLPTPRKRRAVPLWVRYTIGLSAAAAVALLLLVPAAFPPSATEQTPLLADNTNTGETAVVAAAPAQTPTAAPATADTPSTPHTKRSAQTTRNTTHSHNTTECTTDNVPDAAQPSETMVEAAPATLAHIDDTPTTILPADDTPNISIEEAARLMHDQQAALADTDTAGTNERTPRESINLGILASLSPNASEFAYTPSATIAGSQIALRGTTNNNDHHDLPFSVGLSIGIPLCKRLDLQTGINYSYAHSRFTSTNRLQGTYSERNQQLHYLGVPLMLSFRIVDRRIIKFYVSAGGACEKGLIATQHRQTFDLDDALLSSQTNYEYIKGIQGSLTANVGLAVMFFKGMGIYFEPGFTWYIPTEKFPQPVNSRTVHPYNLSLTAGLRFNLK